MKSIKSRVVGAFKDANGKIVIWQSPNLVLVGWVTCKLLSFAVTDPEIDTSLSLFASALLLIWAYLEMTQGVNTFRKILGTVIFGFTTLNYFV